MLKKQYYVLFCIIFSTFVYATTAIASGGEASKAEGEYLDLGAPLVTNLQNRERLSFVQVAVTLALRNATYQEPVKYYLPILRDKLIMLISSKTRSALSTRAGQNTLRNQALQELQAALIKETGENMIDQVLFTKFVLE